MQQNKHLPISSTSQFITDVCGELNHIMLKDAVNPGMFECNCNDTENDIN